jgi:serine/threonine-protein kinase
MPHERLADDVFGEVWLAIGAGERRAILRRVAPALAERRAFAAAFLSHADRLTGLDDPGIVATLAVGRDESGALVVVSEAPPDALALLPALAKLRAAGGVVPVPLAVVMVRQVAQALARAHRAQVVHGGVHPRSLIIDASGRVRIGDFAVSRPLAQAATEDDSLLRGLLGYVAPELALGDPPDARADVFAAGALLHDLLTGSPPPGLIEGPPALVDVCTRALATHADERLPDAGALAAGLDAAAASLGAAPDLGAVRRLFTSGAPASPGAIRSGTPAAAPAVAPSSSAPERAASELALDAQTEDFLADLAAGLGGAPAARLASDPGPGGAFGDEHEPTRTDDTPLPPPMPMDRGETRSSQPFMTRVADPLKHGDDYEPTVAREPNFAGSIEVSFDGTQSGAAQAVRLGTADVIGEELDGRGPGAPPERARTPAPGPRASSPAVVVQAPPRPLTPAPSPSADLHAAEMRPSTPTPLPLPLPLAAVTPASPQRALGGSAGAVRPVALPLTAEASSPGVDPLVPVHNLDAVLDAALADVGGGGDEVAPPLDAPEAERPLPRAATPRPPSRASSSPGATASAPDRPERAPSVPSLPSAPPEPAPAPAPASSASTPTPGFAATGAAAPAAPAPPRAFEIAAPDAAPVSLHPSSRGLWWMAALTLAVAAVVIATQTDLLHPGRNEARARAAAAALRDDQRAAEVARTRRADVIVDSEPAEAAVWMLLGTTPVDSLPLPTTTIYELRIEQQGFRSADVAVTPGRWSGEGDAMRAAFRLKLEPAPTGWEPLPSPPPPPPAEVAPKSGRGQIHVDSDPPGAQVWLLVGFTPSVRIASLAADQDYQFKLTLAGHAPGFTLVRAEEFLSPTGETRAQVVREVTLSPRPAAPGGRGSASEK